jgi:hypothetical protein
MNRAGVGELPRSSEDRTCQRLTTEPVFRLYSLMARTVLVVDGKPARVFPPALTDLQRRVLRLMEIPSTVFTARG